ncbi:NOL11 protein, partial [Leiothrix lutea]|nr:NOL11 protein [Leiothrix lutea]
ISDQKPLGCWSVKHGQILTCPVVCNFETHEYIAVHDDKVLRIWKDEDINLDKAFKATVSLLHMFSSMYIVWLLVAHCEELLNKMYVFKKGNVHESVFMQMLLPVNPFVASNKNFLCLLEKIHFLVLFQDGDFFVYVQKPKLSGVHRYKLEPQESAKPLCFTAHITNQTVTLLCLYSNDSVYQVLIPLQQGTEEEEEKEEEILSKSLLLNLSVSGAVLKGTSLVVLDKDHVAVLGSLAAPGKEPRECLTIWNTKFQTLQTSKELPLGTSGQLWCYEEKFFLIHGKVLTVILYKCETSSLAAAVGKLKDSQTPDVSLFLNWNTLEDEELVVSFQSQESVALKAESRMNLRSRRSTVAGEQPATLPVGQLLVNLKNASTYVLENELKKLMAKAPTPDLQATIGSVVTALTDRCKRNTKYYPQTFLQQIVETHELSYSLCPDLMAVALEKKDMPLLQMCLERFPDIPEEVTYTCLNAFLSMSEAHLQTLDVNVDSVICYIDVELDDKEVKTEIVENGFSADMDQDMCDTKMPQESHFRSGGESCPVGLQKAALLNAVLHSAYTETFLLPHLKNLPAQQAILFLRYLYYLYVKCSEKVNTTLPGIRSPTINQIMDWMCLLLDAQFTVMVMLPEAKDLLSNLHKFVRAQVRFYSELNKIEGSLQELQRLNHLRESQTYSIEVLEII